MNYETHDAERAALYALGALSEGEAREFERHARTCPQCARAIGDAERDVALLVALQPQHQPPLELTARVQRALRPQAALPDPLWRFAAVAAAFIVGLLPSAWLWQENRSMHAAMTEQGAAMDRLVIMDRGRIVEDGDHAKLLQQGGLYAELWARQSGGFLASERAA